MEYKRKRLIRAALQKAEAKRKQTARQAESAADTEQQTPEEYAQTVVSEKTAQAAENVQSKALDTGRISYRQFRILQEKRQRMPTTHAAQPAETENTPFAQSADHRESFKRQRFRQKALDKREIKTPDSYLYKSGSDTYEIEPLSEFLATQVADILCRNNVKYELTFYHGRLASRCKLFTSEQFGLAKMSTLPISNRRNPAALLKFAEQCYNQLHPSLILYKVVTMARIDVLYRNCLYGKQQIQRYWHQKFYSGIMQFH